MWNKLKTFATRHWELISYVLFGGLTTVVNYLIYLPCYNLLDFSVVTSNVLAWTASVIFAFLTNKPFVFQSHDWSLRVTLPEFFKFVGCRLGSGLLETVTLWLTVEYFTLDGNWMKLLVTVLVVIINFVGSKLLVFRKK